MKSKLIDLKRRVTSLAGPHGGLQYKPLAEENINERIGISRRNSEETLSAVTQNRIDHDTSEQESDDDRLKACDAALDEINDLRTSVYPTTSKILDSISLKLTFLQASIPAVERFAVRQCIEALREDLPKPKKIDKVASILRKKTTSSGPSPEKIEGLRLAFNDVRMYEKTVSEFIHDNPADSDSFIESTES